MSTAPATVPSSTPLAFVRWFDVVLVVAAAPFVLLADLPVLGYVAGAAVWVVTRLIGYFAERKAIASQDMKTFTGIQLAANFGRAWLAGLTILAVGLAGEREDGLMAGVLVLTAFTVYFVVALFTRPSGRQG